MTDTITATETPRALTVDEMEARIGQEIAVSPWFLVEQQRIDQFADVTVDHQYIHIDPEAAARTVFGGTIAHGFLTLSLLSHFAEAVPPVANLVMGVNYGFDKVRFLAPVRAGKRIRARFNLAGVTRRGPNEIMTRFQVTVEIEDEDKPALSADWLGLWRYA